MIDHNKIEITYTMTARDYAAMTSAITRRPLRRNFLTLVLSVFSVWCLMVFYMNMLNPIEMMAKVANDIVSTIFFTVLLIFLLTITVGNKWFLWGISHYYYRQLASANATITMTMNETGIKSRSSVASSIVPWQTVKRVMREADHLIVSISAREALIFPRRSFESQKEFDFAIRYANDQVLLSQTRNGLSNA